MQTHIVKMKFSNYTWVLANWMLDQLEKKDIDYYADIINNNDLIIGYRGDRLFNIPLNYNKIQKRINMKKR